MSAYLSITQNLYSAERYSPEIQICTHSEKNQFALNKMSYQNRRPDNSPSYPTQEEEVALPQHLSFRNGQAEMSVRQRNGRQHDRTRFRSRSRSPQSQRASRSRTRSSRIDIPSWNMYDASYQVQQHYSNGPQSATYGPTSPTYDDPGSPSYDDPTSPSCDGPTSPTYADPGSPSYDDPTSSSCDDPTSPTYADPGSPSYDDPTPQYDAPMSPRYEDSVRIDPDVLIEKDGNKKFRINRLIGEGGYGKVFEVREEGTTDLFAIKILKPQQYKTDLFAVELRVFEALKKRPHAQDNLLTMLSCGNLEHGLSNLSKRYFRTQLLGQTLGDAIDSTKKRYLPAESKMSLCMRQVQEIGRQIISAMLHLNSLNIYYLDLKPENIAFVEEVNRISIDNSSERLRYAFQDTRIKLFDFGVCRFEEVGGFVVQTYDYRAPEMFIGHTFSQKTDVWSFAVILGELNCGRPFFPFKDRKLPNCDHAKRLIEFANHCTSEEKVNGEVFINNTHLRDIMKHLLCEVTPRWHFENLTNNHFFYQRSLFGPM
ncbi:hypothetical protein B9Z55_025203 [Caenorhabditis nigoni]|nr:hypothetical protein B9Z55_025203 [Caenorhabditis nigoni]